MPKPKDLKTIILYDLEALKDCFITGNKKDFNYHFNLLKHNTKDLFQLLDDQSIIINFE